MADKPLSLQDHFLNSLRRSKTPVTIFLVKGVKLQGIITWFDPFSLLLRRDGINQLIYKHAMSTILPADPPQDLDLAAFQGAQALTTKTTLQDRFLAAATRAGETMTVFLVNGVMLQGEVVAFNRFSMLLGRGRQVQLVYKHAISTIQPHGPLPLGDADDQGDGK
ncbi:RNA chaperone Hfq [Sphingomonas sp. BN140010]|uniref:RNA-binding protein Hfq n=1 Tax=Sphingomonas arvum TaxID=2992113 RepID=A0ABT3JEY1_9SPHN|nr:RNA chaperone Hfq [Sphingomonas sp. BN140010]MCW3797494.1 RNA chaperone Hfq [Sphingomonas sp. BN140010]